MINLTSCPATLLNQKRKQSAPDMTIEFDSNSSQGDTFAIHRPLTKCFPFAVKEKRMSIDTYEESSSLNITAKAGCNCKNSQCLKRYCECFSRLKFCDSSVCNCKNCFNTVAKKVSINIIILITILYLLGRKSRSDSKSIAEITHFLQEDKR